MLDVNLFEIARKKYLKDKSMPFLDELREQVAHHKPYLGLRIFHNTPLTIATLFKIGVLVAGGAEVTVSWISGLPPQQEALEIIRSCNLRHTAQVPKEDFDVHLDCCAELITHRSPALGTIELTQTGSEIYKRSALDYAVLSVDDSKIKLLETFFGTGDGFVRALSTLVGKEMYNKHFVIFGGGKVGRGIAYALKTYTKHITIIDKINQLNDPTIEFIPSGERKQILMAIKKAYCSITATGVKGLLSDYYALNKADFGSCILTNMGAEDEYGQKFSIHEVAFDKKTFNFSIAEPTAFRYLDPIFYAHNLGINLILENPLPPGYHPFSEKLALSILNRWSNIYQEDINTSLLY